MRQQVGNPLTRQRVIDRAHGRPVNGNEARVLADDVMRQCRFENSGAQCISIAAPAFRIHELTDARAGPQRPNAVAVRARLERQLGRPCAHDRVAADPHGVASSEWTRRAGPDGYGLAEVQVGNDRRVGIDDDSTRPLHLDIGDLGVFELPEQGVHFFVYFVQCADDRIGAAPGLGCLAHEPAVGRGADAHREQPRIAEPLFDHREHFVLVTDAAVGDEHDLPQVGYPGLRGECFFECGTHLGAAFGLH